MAEVSGVVETVMEGVEEHGDVCLDSEEEEKNAKVCEQLDDDYDSED